MTDLLTQAGVSPRDQYNKLGKKRPFYPSEWDLCPRCNRLKKPWSERCNDCWKADKGSVRGPVDPVIYTIEGEKCRKIPLNKGMYAIVSVCDYDWLMDYKWIVLLTNGKHTPYVVTSYRNNGKTVTVRMHHLIRGQCCDHKNRDGLDNRRKNLRDATNSQNAANKGIDRDNRTGYKGVSKQTHYEMYQATISFEGYKWNIGNYPTAKEAAVARDKAAIVLHGEFAFLNFPELIDELQPMERSELLAQWSKLRRPVYR